MYGYIYLTTNLINNKIYIGQHKSEVFDTSYYGSGKHLKNSIKCYGIENFKCEMLCECQSKEELDEKESYFIEKFNSTDKSIGYNITLGGYSLRGYVFTEEDRKKISLAGMNRKPSEQTCKKISNDHKGTKMMNDGVNQLWVHSDNIEYMESIGFTIGSCKKRNRDYSDISGSKNGMCGKSAIKGRKWIHKYVDGQLERLYVFQDELNTYLDSGWEFGMK